MTRLQQTVVWGLPWLALMGGLVALLARRRRSPGATTLGVLAVAVLCPVAAGWAACTDLPTAVPVELHNALDVFTHPLGLTLFVLAAGADRRRGADRG